MKRKREKNYYLWPFTCLCFLPPSLDQDFTERETAPCYATHDTGSPTQTPIYGYSLSTTTHLIAYDIATAIGSRIEREIFLALI